MKKLIILVSVLIMLVPTFLFSQKYKFNTGGAYISIISDTTGKPVQKGILYYLTTNNKLYYPNGTNFVEIGTLSGETSSSFTKLLADSIGGATMDSTYFVSDVILKQNILFEETSIYKTYYLNAAGDTIITLDPVFGIVCSDSAYIDTLETYDLNINSTVTDQETPTFSISGDADSDASATTSETLGLTLTTSNLPTRSYWNFTTTQNSGIAVGTTTSLIMIDDTFNGTACKCGVNFQNNITGVGGQQTNGWFLGLNANANLIIDALINAGTLTLEGGGNITLDPNASGADILYLGVDGDNDTTQVYGEFKLDGGKTSNNIVEFGNDDTYSATGDSALVVNSKAQLISYVPVGTAPFVITSTTAVSNLNADLLDGEEATAFEDADADLTALATLSSTGLVSRTGAATYSERTITGTTAEITVTNGNGVSGDPTLSLPSSVNLGASSDIIFGTTSNGDGNNVYNYGTTKIWCDSTIAGETTLTNILPVGYTIETIIFKNTTANEITNFDIGFSDAGGEIVGAANLLANDEGSFTINQKIDDFDAADTIYLSSDNWNSANLIVWIRMVRIF